MAELQNNILVKKENDMDNTETPCDFSFRCDNVNKNIVKQNQFDSLEKNKIKIKEEIEKDDENIDNIPKFLTSNKRKHRSYYQEEIIKSEMNKKAKNPLLAIYQMYLDKDFFWLENFKQFLSVYVNYKDAILPKSLNEDGSYLFTLAEFWILFIQMKVEETPDNYDDRIKENFITILNNASEYTLENKDCLVNYFMIMVEDLYSNDEMLEIINDNPLLLDRKKSANQITKEDYRYLLTNPDFLTLTSNKHPLGANISKVQKRSSITTSHGRHMSFINKFNSDSEGALSSPSSLPLFRSISSVRLNENKTNNNKPNSRSNINITNFNYIRPGRPNLRELREEIIENNNYQIIKSDFSVIGNKSDYKQRFSLHHSTTPSETFSIIANDNEEMSNTSNISNTGNISIKNKRLPRSISAKPMEGKNKTKCNGKKNKKKSESTKYEN